MEKGKPINQDYESNRESHLKFAFFNIASSKEKLLICLPDILLVEADEYDSRHKIAYIKNEQRAYLLMNVPFSKLHQPGSELIRVNKHTLVAPEAVHSHLYDIITLKDIFPGWKNKQVILSRKYKKDFENRLNIS